MKNESYVMVTIDCNCYITTEKAIGVKVKRDDGVVLHGWEFFPFSQINVEHHVSDRIVRIRIPRWLYNKKISSGYSIASEF